jgi:putative spermidine/putrescine transport system permease protein
MRRSTLNTSYIQVLPLAFVLLVFLVIPIVMIVIVSFWDFNSYQIIPAFILDNYHYMLTSEVTWRAYIKTLFYALSTWAVTLLIGFTVAYYLAFHVKTVKVQIFLFILATIPFFTSNIIRMISWIPLLGRNGIINSILAKLGVVNEPLEFLLYSDFSVILAFVHLYTLFMVVPIFNSMMRIDRNLIEAAIDAGASPFRVLSGVVIPLSKSGITIGTVFVFTLVMGDFVTVRLMSGGMSASVGVLISNEISLLQYPAAASTAVLLLITVLIMLSALFRVVSIRKDL